MDELAHSIQMDPIEFRLKNRIHEGDDLCSAPKKVVSTVGVEEAARKGAETIGWERGASLTTSSGGARNRGMGMAMVVHGCASDPAGTSYAAGAVDSDGPV